MSARDRSAGTPWASALGWRIDQLPPALAEYFRGVPYGSHGLGEGVFERVGSPRVWLWPLLALLGRWNVAWPVWEKEVRFTIVNVPTPHGQISVRRFHFDSGDRTMTDRIVWTSRGLRQRMGAGERMVSELFVQPDGDELLITSGRVGVELAGLRFTLPPSWAPRITVRERALDDGRQHVDLAIDLPIVGRLYEYAGAFTYSVEHVGDRDEA